MTVVVNSRDDFTLANFRRVSYGGEPARLGGQARRALMAGAQDRPAVDAPSHDHAARAWPLAPGPSLGGCYIDVAVVRGILFARLASLVSGHAGVRPSVAAQVAALLDGPLPRVPLDGQVSAGEALPMTHVLAGLRRDDLHEGEERALLGGAPC